MNWLRMYVGKIKCLVSFKKFEICQKLHLFALFILYFKQVIYVCTIVGKCNQSIKSNDYLEDILKSRDQFFEIFIPAQMAKSFFIQKCKLASGVGGPRLNHVTLQVNSIFFKNLHFIFKWHHVVWWKINCGVVWVYKKIKLQHEK